MQKQAAENNKISDRRHSRYRFVLLLLFAVLSITLVACDRGKEAEELDLQEARRLRGTQESNTAETNEDEERPTLTLNPDRAIQPSQRRMIFRSIPQEYRTTTTPPAAPTQTSTAQVTTPSSVAPETTPPTTVAPTTLAPTTTPSTTQAPTTTTMATTTTPITTTATTTETTEPTEPQPTHPDTYEIQPNDSLYAIAEEVYADYGPLTSDDIMALVQQIQAANPDVIVGDNFNVGDVITIPEPQFDEVEVPAEWETIPTTAPTTEPTTEPTTAPTTEPTTEATTTEATTTEQTTVGLINLILDYQDEVNIQTIELTPGTNYALPRPERTGFNFLQWTYVDQTPVNSPDSFLVPENDITLYAQWEQAAPTTVILTLNYNDDQNIVTSEQIPGTTYALQSPQRDGFNFVQWVYADQSPVYSPEAFVIPEHDVTLYAQWDRLVVVTLDYQYKVNETDQENKTSKSEHTPGTTYTLPTPERSGYKFLGWTNTDDSPVSTPEAFVIPEHDVTLYAQWDRLVVVTLDYQYKVNETDQENKTSKIEGKPGDLKPLPKQEEVTRPGYKFKEWTTDRDGEKPVPTPGSYTLPDSDVTLYAQWEVDPPSTDPAAVDPSSVDPPTE